MEFIGRVSGISQDYATGAFTVSFTTNNKNAVVSGYETIKDIDKLDIKAVKHRKKRSLDANAYAWVLMSHMAYVLNTSKDEVYEEMLHRYGRLYEDDEGYIIITVKETVDIGKLSGHWQLLKTNGEFKAYAQIKGSSEYDTKEMSDFIDGIVSEAKELGIETIPPMELERMKAGWKA